MDQVSLRSFSVLDDCHLILTYGRPLVYPKTGKKKAEVEKQDLERLHDSEFLNDNLIGFYVRFLEHHLERTRPDLAKRMYFFNSYFFASLTNTPRGVKGINYQAVQKWTRAVDIFSYDYIVVPINESAHWYVAIICNLPNLIRSIADGEKPDDTREDTGAPKESHEDQEPLPPPPAVVNEDREAAGDTTLEPQSEKENNKGEGLPRSLCLMTLSDQAPESSPVRSRDASPQAPDREHSDKEDWPDEDENQPSNMPTPPRTNHEETTKDRRNETDLAPKSENVGSGKKKGHKKPRPPVQKYDPQQPIIVSFDSLGCNRSPMISVLREYLQEEAKSKLSLTFDGKLIKGMMARQIPLQPNFSDCGLYLLAYLEKFIRDPDTFTTKTLRRSMAQHDDWPKLRSGELRRRLLRFLLDLYEEQNADKGQKHESGPFIVDTKPLHILLRDEEPTTDHDQTPKYSAQSRRSPGPESRPTTPKRADREEEGADKTEHPKQPSTPVRSSPRFNRTERAEKQQSASPVVAVEKPEPAAKEADTELLDQLEEVIQQGRASSSQQQEAYVPETPPPDDRNVAESAISQSPSAVSPARRSKRSKVAAAPTL